jgi:hypothetical protein
MVYKKTEWEYHVGQFVIYPSLDGRFTYVDHPDFLEQGIYAVVYPDGEIILFREQSLEELIKASFCRDFFIIYRGYNPSDILPDRRTKKYKRLKKAIRVATDMAKRNAEFWRRILND